MLTMGIDNEKEIVHIFIRWPTCSIVRGEAVNQTLTSFQRGEVHLFSRDGAHFLYSPGLNSFFKLDEIALTVLQDSSDGDTANSELALAARRASPQNSSAAEAELEWLSAMGLFSRPMAELTPDQRKNRIRHWLTRARTKIELALTQNCNMACKYCYCGGGGDKLPDGPMSKDTARRTIDWLFENSRRHKRLTIVLFGGEPLVNRSTLEFVI